MKKPSIRRVLFLVMLIMVIISSCIIYYNYSIYKSLKVVGYKDVAIEYGSADCNINQIIKKVEGEIVSIQYDVDTSHVGEQEVLVKVRKLNVTKEVPIVVEVVDTVAPVITLKGDSLTYTKGDSLNFLDLVESIRDDVDGDIPYNNQDDPNGYFTYYFVYDENTIGDVGDHVVSLYAKDKNGNTSIENFMVHINAPKVVYSSFVQYNAPINPSGGDVVSIAYSLLGAPYAYMGYSPAGFDCSGFVSYVYAQVGIPVSRSSSAQLYEGIGVPYSEAQPGDIISWGYTGPTHSALYVGNGKMIHAATYGLGVILSDVDGWARGNGSHILSVRRVQ